MRKIIFGFLACAGLLFSGCEPSMEGCLSLAVTDTNGNQMPSVITFEPTNGVVTLCIVSPMTSWKVTYLPSWLQMPMSGSGTTTIDIVADENKGNERSGIITLSTTFGDKVSISVKQEAMLPISIYPNTLVFSSEGGVRTIQVTANTVWSISGLENADWLTVFPDSGSGGATTTVSLLAASNLSATESRQATLSFTAPGIDPVTLLVTQEPTAPFLMVNTNLLNFSADGESKSFEVTANTSWTITGMESWFTVTPTSGSGNATVWVTAQENGPASIRNASLTLQGQGVATPVAVNVQQEKSSLKSAPPWPERITNWDYNYNYSPVTYQGSDQTNAYFSRVAEKFGDDTNTWPTGLKDPIATIWFLGCTLNETIPYVVTNEVLCELTNWYPATTDNLTVSISQITETSVTEEIKRSAGLTIGNDNVGGITGSIEHTSSKTVTKSQGLSIESFYDLTKYEQNKEYKVILVGMVYYGYFTIAGSDTKYYYAQVDESSLSIMLVQRPMP